LRIILAIWLMVFSCLNHACDQGINLVYGPFYSARFYNEYIFKFHENIERITGCHITSQLIPSYEAYLKRLTQGGIYMTFVPGHYEYALSQYGFKPMLKGAVGAKILLVSKIKKYKEMNIRQLEGETILVPSIYTDAYLYLMDWLEESAMTEKVNISSNTSHDDIAVKLITDRASVGALSTTIYNRMPASVRDDFFVFKTSGSSHAVLMVAEDLPHAIHAAIIDSISLINLGEWFEYDGRSQPDEHARAFKRQLDALLKNNE